MTIYNVLYSQCLQIQSFCCSCITRWNVYKHSESLDGTTVVLYTHEKCNLFVLYNKNSNGLLKDLGGMKREKQVGWRDLTWFWRYLCVFFYITIKIHKEVILLHKIISLTVPCFSRQQFGHGLSWLQWAI